MRARTKPRFSRALVLAATLLGLVVLAWAARSSAPAGAATTCSTTSGTATVNLDQSTAGAFTSLSQDGSGDLVVNGSTCSSGFPTTIDLDVTTGQPAPLVSLDQTGAGGAFPCTATIQGDVGGGDIIVVGAGSVNLTAGNTATGSGVNLNSCSSVGTIQNVHSYKLVAGTGAVVLSAAGGAPFSGPLTIPATLQANAASSQTFHQGAVQDTIDFSSLNGSLTVNESGAPAGLTANHAATSGANTYTFDAASSGTGFLGSQGPTTFLAGTAPDTFLGHDPGHDTLSYAAASGSSLHICVAAASGCAAGQAVLGAVQEQFSGIEGFTGLAGGNTSFVAAATGGYAFAGSGTGNVLDASAAPAGSVVDAHGGTLTGLTGGVQDTFTGISTFTGSASGDTTFVAGSTSETFMNPAAAAGDSIDFSNVATTPSTQLAVNVTGGPVGFGGNTVANHTASVATTTYTFTTGGAGFTSFTGAASGNTTFLAGSTGGDSFSGQSNGNVLDASTASSGITINADTGAVTGLTSGGPDTFTGIPTLVGSAAGATTFVAPATGGYAFFGSAGGNILDVTAAAGAAHIDTVNDVVTGLAGNSVDNFAGIASFQEALRFTSTPKMLTTVGDTYAPAVTGTQSSAPVTLDVDASTTNSACHITSGTVFFDHAGKCAIAANQATDGQFLDAPQLLQQIQVNPNTTTTALSAQPTGPVAGGTPVTLSATVSPAVAGTVQFRDGATNVGAPVPVSAGLASTTLTLTSARHPLTAQFVPQSAADYISSTSDILTFVVDGTAPTVQLFIPFTTPTSSTSAELGFSASDADSPSVSFTCRLDAGPEAACTSPWSLTGLGDGAHTFNVTATDGVGNSGHAATTWTVDTIKPVVTLSTPAGPTVLTPKTTVHWTGSDANGSGVATYQLRFRQAGWSGGFGAWSTPSNWQHLTTTSVSAAVPVGYTRCFSVLAIDKAGNSSAWSAARCAARPLDDRALKASAGWSKKKSAGYYLGTYTGTVRKGATLSRAGARLDRVGLVATTCATCGRVEVFVGSKLIGTINLHRVKTRHEVAITLPVFARRTGTVMLKVVTSGKTVQIDGLLVSSA